MTQWVKKTIHQATDERICYINEDKEGKGLVLELITPRSPFDQLILFFKDKSDCIRFRNSCPSEINEVTTLIITSFNSKNDIGCHIEYGFSEVSQHRYTFKLINKYLLALVNIKQALPDDFSMLDSEKDKVEINDLSQAIIADPKLAFLKLWQTEINCSESAWALAQYYEHNLKMLDVAIEWYQRIPINTKHYKEANQRCANIINHILQAAQNKLITLSQEEIKNHKKMYFSCLLEAENLIVQRTTDQYFSELCGQRFSSQPLIENVGHDTNTLLNLADVVTDLTQTIESQKEIIQQQAYSLAVQKNYIAQLEKNIKLKHERSLENFNDLVMSDLNNRV